MIKVTLFGVGYSPEFYHFGEPRDVIDWLIDRGSVVEVSVEYVQ